MGAQISAEPLVTIGVPVRNGGLLLRDALDSITTQTHRNLEVLIADNCSDDDTDQVCRDLAESDDRVSYHRHPSPIPVMDNFRWLYERAGGQYFMWCAHDDLRSPDYVECLLRTIEQDPNGLIAYSDAETVVPGTEGTIPIKVPEPSPGLSFWRRISRYSGFGGSPIYGLIRKDCFAGWPWYDLDHSPDLPMLLYAALRGELLKSPGGKLYRGRPVERKSPKQRALDNFYRKVRPFREERLVWTMVKAARLAEAGRGRRRSPLLLFAFIYCRRRRRLSTMMFRLYALSPKPVRLLARRLRDIAIRSLRSSAGT